MNYYSLYSEYGVSEYLCWNSDGTDKNILSYFIFNDPISVIIQK